jgi:hypothetical protein
MAGRPKGAQNKDKPFRTALMLELKAAGEDMPELRRIARKLIERAAENPTDCKELADRLDGKAPQAVVGDDEHDPIRAAVTVIENVIVKAENADGGGVPTPPEAGEV